MQVREKRLQWMWPVRGSRDRLGEWGSSRGQPMRDLEGRPSSYIGNLAKSEDLNANFRSRYRTMENTLTLCRLGASFCICYVNGRLQRKGMLEITLWLCLATKIKRRKRYWKLISRDKKEKNGMNDYFFPLGQQTQLFELWFRRQVPGMKISWWLWRTLMIYQVTEDMSWQLPVRFFMADSGAVHQSIARAG